MSAEVEFTAALVIAGDYVYIAAALAGLPAYSPHTRLFLYDGQSQQPWTKHDVSFWTIGLEKIPDESDDEGGWILCALSEEGDVELMSATADPALERIPDAGLRGPTSKGYGYLLSLRRIGGHLHACGSAGQVYKRLGPGRWVHMDAGLLQAPNVKARLLLQDINGAAEDDIYVVGDIPGPGGPEGRLFHWNGSAWRPVDIPSVGALNALHVEDRDRVWVCGARGTILRGNHRDGFDDLTTPGSRQLFHAMTVHDGVLYLGSNFGLFQYDPQRGRVARVRTGLEVEPSYVSTLGQADGVLWGVGPKDIVYFDRRTWTRVQHPDNPKI